MRIKSPYSLVGIKTDFIPGNRECNRGMLQGIEQRRTENGYALAAIRDGVLAGKVGMRRSLLMSRTSINSR